MQMDVYTFILEQLGLKTAGKAYFVFYQVDKTDGFNSRLPFRGEIREVKTDSSYIHDMFSKAVALARSATPPPSHTECECCTWWNHHAKAVSEEKLEQTLFDN